MQNVVRVPARDALYLRVLGHSVEIRCQDATLKRLVSSMFGAMHAPPEEVCDLLYEVHAREAGSFRIIRSGAAPIEASDTAALAFYLEKDIIIELQKKRADLLFLHAAAVEWLGHGLLITAPSGTGKSTTTWALLHHGFGYLSDELAPIDLANLDVLQYPHPLCLKKPPPAPYVLPAYEPFPGPSIHIPTVALPSAVVHEITPLSVVFVLEYLPRLSPAIREMSAAEATVRMYSNALNLLAHRNQGLDAIVRIAENTPCFLLRSGELAATAELVRSTAEKMFGAVMANL